VHSTAASVLHNSHRMPQDRALFLYTPHTPTQLTSSLFLHPSHPASSYTHPYATHILDSVLREVAASVMVNIVGTSKTMNHRLGSFCYTPTLTSWMVRCVVAAPGPWRTQADPKKLRPCPLGCHVRLGVWCATLGCGWVNSLVKNGR